jgi:RNA polymerase sigma-70 factor, ECF subfamily
MKSLCRDVLREQGSIHETIGAFCTYIYISCLATSSRWVIWSEEGTITVAEPSADIIRRAQAGDSEAITQLILSQQHYVYSIAMSVLKNPDDAADLTQEAFIRLFRALPQYNGESRFTTWLYRLVVNLGRDELRRRGRQVPLVPPVMDEEDQDPVSMVADDDRWADPELALDSQELRGEVRRALDQLEEHYRLVLTLYYFEDMKYNDIADILGIPLNTVKSHIRRGKDRLAVLLQAQEQPPAMRAIISSKPERPHTSVNSFARLLSTVGAR